MKRPILVLFLVALLAVGAWLTAPATAQYPLPGLVTQRVSAVCPSQAAATTTSYQCLAGDFQLGAAWGSSTAASPVYGGGVMGNIITTANLSATKNILFGVLGKWDASGTNASTYPGAALVGEIGGDPITTSAYAAVMAVMGGDAGLSSAVTAYGVDWQNSTATSRFNFGLDLQGNGTHDAYIAPRYNIAHLRFGGRTLDANDSTVSTANNICIAVITDAPVDGASGTRVNSCGPGSLLIRTTSGTVRLYINTNTLASPTWTIVGTQS